eukprot:TRINITY_DN5483_c0_g1_i1.p1 TRINITY_DN5483_c0_g1~~TRINITY_DN5483_c0_g1_i1.p1  ORF type:complete len:178 (+),score=13.65 TRINITY_DN5483_c0_g1_i1:78-536(+)
MISVASLMSCFMFTVDSLFESSVPEGYYVAPPWGKSACPGMPRSADVHPAVDEDYYGGGGTLADALQDVHEHTNFLQNAADAMGESVGDLEFCHYRVNGHKLAVVVSGNKKGMFCRGRFRHECGPNCETEFVNMRCFGQTVNTDKLDYLRMP